MTLWFLVLQEAPELVSSHGGEHEVDIFSPQPQGQCIHQTPGRVASFWPGFINCSSDSVHQVLVPALMVTAGHDPVLLPSLSEGMEDRVRKTRWNARRLLIIDANLNHFCLDPESEQRPHRGVWTLDAVGQTGRDQPHPDWMAEGNAQEVQTVNKA